MEEQAAAYGTHENDGNTHKRQRREHTSFNSRVDEMFSSLLAPHTGDLLASSCVVDELHLYLKEPVVDRRKGDLLQWWRQNEGRFKLLAKQAKKFLCAPPSSVPSEHVFSEVSILDSHFCEFCFIYFKLQGTIYLFKCSVNFIRTPCTFCFCLNLKETQNPLR